MIKVIVFFLATILLQDAIAQEKSQPNRKPLVARDEMISYGAPERDLGRTYDDGYLHFNLKQYKGNPTKVDVLENYRFLAKEQIAIKLKEFLDDCAKSRKFTYSQEFYEKEVERYHFFLDFQKSIKAVDFYYNYFQIRTNFVRICGRALSDDLARRISELEKIQQTANPVLSELEKNQKNFLKIEKEIVDLKKNLEESKNNQKSKPEVSSELDFANLKITEMISLAAILLSLIAIVINLKKKK
jgi:hypothetical protein